MQTDAQIRSSTTYTGCFFTPWRSDKQARARQDALTVGFDDPAIDPMTGAEVIPSDDEILHDSTPPWAKKMDGIPLWLACLPGLDGRVRKHSGLCEPGGLLKHWRSSIGGSLI